MDKHTSVRIICSECPEDQDYPTYISVIITFIDTTLPLMTKEEQETLAKQLQDNFAWGKDIMWPQVIIDEPKVLARFELRRNWEEAIGQLKQLTAKDTFPYETSGLEIKESMDTHGRFLILTGEVHGSLIENFQKKNSPLQQTA